jgi:DNA-binding beta-propeller fold protein YncE
VRTDPKSHDQLDFETISIGKGEIPAIAIDSEHHKIYVSYYDLGQIIIIDGLAKKVDSSISVPHVIRMEVNPVLKKLYALRNDGITIIDTLTNQVVGIIKLEGNANYMSLNPSKDHVYVSIDGGLVKPGYLVILDALTNLEVARIIVDAGPRGIAFNESEGLIYLANSHFNSITIIDAKTHKPIEAIDVKSPSLLFANSMQKVIYVISRASSSTYGGGHTWETLYVVNQDSGDVINKIEFDSDENGFDFNPTLNQIYVKETSTNTFFKLDGLGKEILGKRKIGKVKRFHGSLRRGDVVAIDRKTNKLYVTDHETGSLDIFEG